MGLRFSKLAPPDVLIGLALAGAAACNDAPTLLTGDDIGQQQDAIVNGTLDSDHPAIGALHSGNEAACTATLVGKRTVLTAAHCVTSKNPPYQILSPVHFYIGGLYTGTKYTAAAVAVHSGYAGGNKADIAVVRLSSDVTGVAPMPIAKTAPSTGETVVLVGYGKTGESSGSFGTKRKATNVIDSLDATTFYLSGTSNGHGNVCNGDSGGPTLAMRGGAEAVIGVHSTKLNYCGYGATDMRVDAYQSWIASAAQGDLYEGGPLDTQPPAVAITSPAPGAAVAASFTARVSASDDTGVTKVVLYLNAQKVSELTAKPYDFQLSNVAWGKQTLEAVAHDKANHTTSTSITVTVQGPQQAPLKAMGGSCGKDSECTSQLCVGGEAARYCSRTCGASSPCPLGYACSSAVCVKGQAAPQGNGGSGGSSGAAGGYGAACTGPSSCTSGLCALDNVTGKRFCTSFCSLTADTCGQGSACQPVGGSSGKAVCGPLHDALDADRAVLAGGCSLGQNSGALWPLALVALALVGRRRRSS